MFVTYDCFRTLGDRVFREAFLGSSCGHVGILPIPGRRRQRTALHVLEFLVVYWPTGTFCKRGWYYLAHVY